VDGLYEWRAPERLEDMCFLRDDGTPVLATISHEHDAFMELTNKEFEELLKAVPDLRIEEHDKTGDVNS